MDNPRVTILVAVWNTAPWLSQCLDSLRRQTLSDIQIVCVDDGSTDNSLSVLNRYASLDKRIEIIALAKNQGQAHARNVALRHARGAYICFLDSDDWMAADCLEQAVRTFSQYPNTGCVLFHTLYYYSPNRQEAFRLPSFQVLSGEQAFMLSLTWQIHGVYMVRASIHKRFPYDESAHAFSDDNTTRFHYLASAEVRACSGTYYYRQRQSSVSHLFNVRRFDYLTANLSMKRQLESLHMSDQVLDLYEHHRWLNVVDMYMLWYRHRSQLTPFARLRCLSTIRLAWRTIETRRIASSLKYKFGYWPLPGHWRLFVLQEEAYFRIRHLLLRR